MAVVAGTGSAGTLGDLLGSRRRRRFVGRASEVELFRLTLESSDPLFSVLYVQGPGGIGKTTLLDAFGESAAQAGASVVRLDGRDISPSPSAVLEGLGGVLEVPDGDGAIVGPPGTSRVVVLLDSYERLTLIDGWFRRRLLTRLPDTCVTVIAGRDPPTSAWRADPAWRELFRVVSLRNLGPPECREYLHAGGVDPTLHDSIIQVTHGHPLGLSLLADVVSRGGQAVADPLAPDLVGALVRRFVDVAPSGLHRRALEVCALARVTTEPLLRDALQVDDAHELFAWLRELSFIEAGPEGLYPHDLARDVLDRDLRWRDLEGYKRVFRSVRAHIHRCLKSARSREQLQALFDEKFLFRNLPSILSPVDWETWGRHHPEQARAEDRKPILAMVLAAEGEESAAIAERWLDSQPQGFHVVRREDGPIRGVLAVVDLTEASVHDIAADPGARTAWEYAERHGPPRPGEVVSQCRFIVDAEAYQGPSPTLNAAPIVTIQRYLRTPNLAWDFLTLAEPEPWDAYFAVADLPRATGADFMVAGRRFGLFCHDFRQVPVDAWLELVTERALAQDFTLPPVRSPDMLVLSQPEFEEAVRQALRDLHRPDPLSRNPLLRTRLVRDRAGGQPSAAVLEAVVREAIETLQAHPRDDKLFRAVERTYARPARTQEGAAASLGLPFSTYRRHLTQGTTRVVSWLWAREVYGSGEHQ
jgi:hypothetical protein